MKTENQKVFNSGFPLGRAVTQSSLSRRVEVRRGGGCRVWENVAVRRGQEILTGHARHPNRVSGKCSTPTPAPRLAFLTHEAQS